MSTLSFVFFGIDDLPTTRKIRLRLREEIPPFCKATVCTNDGG